MLQASQNQVMQEANMALVKIRNAEIDYFSQFFANFGTQAALMFIFITGSLSQVPGVENPSDCPYPWVVMYWFSSAGTLAYATHILICTLVLTVYGEGLAIRGPEGSMVKAVDGMVEEQANVFFYFNVMIAFFTLQCISMYWIMMDAANAWASTGITLAFVYLWYHYALRIYNKFKWSKYDPTNVELSAMKDITQKFTGDYLAIKTKQTIGSGTWIRYYVVIRGTNVFYYKNKRSFELDNSMSINRRPIDLDGYTIVAGAKEPPYLITLVPVDPDDIRKTWNFRCDTIGEFNNWIEKFLEAFKKCENFTTKDDFIKINDGASEVLSTFHDYDEEEKILNFN